MCTPAFSSVVFFNELFNSMFAPFRAYIAGRFTCLTSGDIEDLYQETMLDVSNNIQNGKVSPDTNWAGYIKTIGFRKAIALKDEFNHKQFTNYCQNLNQEDTGLNIHAVEAILNTETDEEDTLLNKTNIEIMYSVIDTLPEMSRAIISGYLQKKRTSDIAEELGYKNSTTVKSRKKQILNQMKPRLIEALESREYNFAEIHTA